ncbi:hypothetical protein EGH21_23065 [Halomicroarcula sp. F13]|uniref:DOD-type homing endonuclease domain-containing protein n=1 Tax=Haloarcula rubra TaxID=2487747 RepID=A0AAW4Q069_9EURY|nr:hypothetical protein [Halomicroarcula rubra]MBX0325903.1 hypothetical protein [Halomicroarcula rubra]
MRFSMEVSEILAATPQQARVLLADMTWEPVNTLEVGQRVVTFDEQPDDHRYRMYRVGEITDVEAHQAETVQIATPEATVCVPTDHSFLAKKWNKSVYLDAEQLGVDDDIYWFVAPTEYEENDAYREGYITGAFCGDGSVPGWKDRIEDPRNRGSYVSSIDEEVARTVVKYAEEVAPEFELSLKRRQYTDSSETAMMPVSPGACDDIIRDRLTAEPPKHDEDYARGWLAGMLDTDGTYPEGKELGYCQYEGSIFTQVCDYLDLLGYDWSHDEGETGEYSDKIRLTPGRETGRVFEHLLEIRPKVSRKRLAFVGNRRIGGQTTVNSIEAKGTNTVHRVSTTEGTLITEGMLSRSQ